MMPENAKRVHAPIVGMNPFTVRNMTLSYAPRRRRQVTSVFWVGCLLLAPVDEVKMARRTREGSVEPADI